MNAHHQHFAIHFCFLITESSVKLQQIQSSFSPPKTAVGTDFCSNCTSAMKQCKWSDYQSQAAIPRHHWKSLKNNHAPSELTIWFPILCILIIINVNLIWISLFGQFCEFTARGVTPVQTKQKSSDVNGTIETSFSTRAEPLNKPLSRLYVPHRLRALIDQCGLPQTRAQCIPDEKDLVFRFGFVLFSLCGEQLSLMLQHLHVIQSALPRNKIWNYNTRN